MHGLSESNTIEHGWRFEKIGHQFSNFPMKGEGSAQQPIDVEDSDGEEELPLICFGSASNASNVPTASSDTIETSEQSDTEPEAMEVWCHRAKTNDWETIWN